jgi:hypothetical protein
VSELIAFLFLFASQEDLDVSGSFRSNTTDFFVSSSCIHATAPNSFSGLFRLIFTLCKFFVSYLRYVPRLTLFFPCKIRMHTSSFVEVGGLALGCISSWYMRVDGLRYLRNLN